MPAIKTRPASKPITTKAAAKAAPTKRKVSARAAKANPQVADDHDLKISKTDVFLTEPIQADFQAYCQANFADLRGLENLIATLKSPIEFIDNEVFPDSTAESVVLGDSLFSFGDETSERKPVKLADMPVHLARLCETRLLKPEEERALFQKMNYLRYQAERIRSAAHKQGDINQHAIAVLSLLRAADWYRDAIVKANMRLVISIVKKFVNTSNNFDDLLSDGIIALIRAVDKFDFDRGFRFSTYATQVVRRNAYRNVMQKQKERLQVTASLSEGGLDISDEAKPSSMSEGRWNELRSKLAGMLDTLDRREKLIIRARFSLGGHRNVKTLQCLADRLGVSKERVRQLEKRSLEKLRGMVGNPALLVDSTDADENE